MRRFQYHLRRAKMNADLCFKFSKSNWEALCPGLHRNDEAAWTKAIDVFEKRMKQRFFSCIDALEKADTKPPDQNPSQAATDDDCVPGFAIVALCCLLIETLQRFREEVPPLGDPPEPCSFPQGACIKPGLTRDRSKRSLGGLHLVTPSTVRLLASFTAVSATEFSMRLRQDVGLLGEIDQQARLPLPRTTDTH